MRRGVIFFGYFKYVLIAGTVVAVIAVGFGASASDLSADLGITRCRRSIAKDLYLAPARSTRIGPFLLRSDRAPDRVAWSPESRSPGNVPMLPILSVQKLHLSATDPAAAIGFYACQRYQKC